MYEGRERGRIYRVVRADAPRRVRPRRAWERRAMPTWSRALESPNLWWRRTAQRLLVDRQSRQAIAPLRAMAATSPSPLARVHALWTLDGLGALDDASIASAMGDATPGVRENAVRLAEPRLRSSASLASRLDRHGGRARRTRPLRRRSARSGRWPRRTPRPRAAPCSSRTSTICGCSGRPSARVRSGAGARRRAAAATDPRCWRTASDSRAAFVRQLASIVGARQKPAEVAHRPGRRVRRPASAEASWWRAALLEGLAQGAQGRRSARDAAAGARAALLALLDDAAAERARRHARPAAARGLRRRRGVAGGGAAGGHDRRTGRRCAAARRRHRAGLAGLPGAARRLAGAIRGAARAGRRPGRRGDRARPHRSATPSRRPAGPPARARRRSARTRRSDSSSWRSGRAFTPDVRSHAGDVLIADPTRARLLVDALAAGNGPAVEPRLLAEAGSRAPQGPVDSRGGARGARGGSAEARRHGAPLRGGARPRGRPDAGRAGVRPRVRRLSSARRHRRRRSRPGPRHGPPSAAGEPAGRHPAAQPVDRATLRDLRRRAPGRGHGGRPPRRGDAHDDHACGRAARGTS